MLDYLCFISFIDNANLIAIPHYNSTLIRFLEICLRCKQNNHTCVYTISTYTHQVFMRLQLFWKIQCETSVLHDSALHFIQNNINVCQKAFESIIFYLVHISEFTIERKWLWCGKAKHIMIVDMNVFY